MLDLDHVGEGIFVAREPIVSFGDEEALFLKQQALISPRKRARICAHKSNQDTLHEMLIAMSGESYIHPHRHIGKSESFHIVQGRVDVVIFNDVGEVTNLVELGPPGSGRNFFYRLSDSRFHTLLIRTELLILHEVTDGPFDKSQTVLASFAPPEEKYEEVRAYMKHIDEKASKYFRSRQ